MRPFAFQANALPLSYATICKEPKLSPVLYIVNVIKINLKNTLNKRPEEESNLHL